MKNNDINMSAAAPEEEEEEGGSSENPSGGGASSLMSLFEPPPPSSNSGNGSNDTAATNCCSSSSSNDSHEQEVLALQSRQKQQKHTAMLALTESNSTGGNVGNGVRESTTDDKEEQQQTPISPTPKSPAISSLMSLFHPPPSSPLPASSAIQRNDDTAITPLHKNDDAATSNRGHFFPRDKLSSSLLLLPSNSTVEEQEQEQDKDIVANRNNDDHKQQSLIYPSRHNNSIGNNNSNNYYYYNDYVNNDETGNSVASFSNTGELTPLLSLTRIPSSRSMPHLMQSSPHCQEPQQQQQKDDKNDNYRQEILQSNDEAGKANDVPPIRLQHLYPKQQLQQQQEHVNEASVSTTNVNNSYNNKVRFCIVDTQQQQRHDQAYETELNGCENGNDEKKNRNNLDRIIIKKFQNLKSRILGAKCGTSQDIKSTFIGSVIYTLYNVVFNLAMASAVHPPYRTTSMLGPIAKLCTMAVMTGAPLLIWSLGPEAPALYPTIDLFLAPFVAQMINVVDTSMYEQILQHQTMPAGVGVGVGKDNDDDNSNNIDKLVSDDAFLATFVTLFGIGLFMTTMAIILASKFKMANLGAFLPYAVLCGFFSGVGITLWTLALSVDTGGQSVKHIVLSGSYHVWFNAIMHHVPSLILGTVMFIYGPRNPLMVPAVTLVTVGVAYTFMFVGGYTLSEAQDAKWFWTESDLIYIRVEEPRWIDNWVPPSPFGVFGCLITGHVNFKAVLSGMPTALAMAVIYFLRVYLHATALRKSVKGTLEQKKKQLSMARTVAASSKLKSPRSRLMSRAVSDVSYASFPSVGDNADVEGADDQEDIVLKGPPDTMKILKWYGIIFSFIACIGGSAVVPSIAVGPSLFKLGADGFAPQYGSAILLAYFYFSDFVIVGYIPKVAFSSLLVLSALEMLSTWFVKSFIKIDHKAEWIVVPIIIVFSYVIGMLESVALGVALSTFIFVAAFYRSGVVKFTANGLMIRSNVERTNPNASWLDQHGDYIQILVLQNYLFFGNASSCLHYIQSMFEDPPDSDFPLPPIPKYLIIDFRLVTGMDASAVDVLADTFTLCQSSKCKLFFSGLSPNLRSVLSNGGLKPITLSSDRTLKFYSDLETALGKSEDGLLREVRKVEVMESQETVRRKQRVGYEERSGFRSALDQIDDQHGTNYAPQLEKLRQFTKPIEVKAGQCLFECHGGLVDDSERGLFFIERGLMRVERDPTYSLTRTTGNSLRRRVGPYLEKQRLEAAGGSIGHLNARSRTVGNMDAFMKGMAGQNRQATMSTSFRLARIGPGWVIGATESCTGIRTPGLHVAVTPCKLHHLPHEKMIAIEKTDPLLMLQLVKLLAQMLSRRHDVAVEQLATLHSIISSSPPTKPVSRTTLGAINKALMSCQ